MHQILPAKILSFISIFILFNCFNNTLIAQCPTITCPSTVSYGCTSPVSVTATSNYSANITSKWYTPGGTQVTSVGTATSVAVIQSAGIFTVTFKDNVSGCVTSKTLTSISTAQFSFDYLLNTNLLCNNSIISGNFIAQQTGGGPVSFTVAPSYLPLPTTTTLSGNSSFTTNICGDYWALASDNLNCRSVVYFSINCSTNTPIQVTASGPNTVCLGSSITFTGNGVSTYTWNTGVNTNTCNVILTNSASLGLAGTDLNGCYSYTTVPVNVNLNCANVFPGDANSDGVVDNNDVLELGLQSGFTGPARTTTSNAYVSQFANVWTGTISTGKNRVHADCNGDGVVNAADNTAITSNFGLNHAFKENQIQATNPDLFLMRAGDTLSAGNWNKVDIMLGDNVNTMSQLYGLAYTLNYDNSVIVQDSVKLVYTPSFLSANNQNITLQKFYFANGKMYGASVRTDHNNVNGNGKIAEFYFKLKFGLGSNPNLNISVSNAKMISNNALAKSLSGGSSSFFIDQNALEVSKKFLENEITIYPNPAKENIALKNYSALELNYCLTDLFGRELMRGEFSQQKNLDLSQFKSGIYFITFQNGSNQCQKKLIVQND